MSRSLPAPIGTAIVKAATRPAYLLRLALENGSPATDMLAATWDSDILWNGETWSASGIEVKNLSRTACTIEFPLGENDPWAAVIRASGVLNRAVSIYQHYTDLAESPQAGAELMFTGVMDQAVWSDKITVPALEKSRVTSFPPESVDQPKFNYFLTSGAVIVWGGGVLTVR
jgi:hypothetical protein